MQRSAALGALAILAMGGIGVPIVFVMGIMRRDLKMALSALGLLVLLILSGAAGGVVHYYTRPLRQAGQVGHYTSSILSVYGYMGAVSGLLAVAALFVGWDAIDPDLSEMLTTSSGWIVLAVVSTFFGIVFGYHTRE